MAKSQFNFDGHDKFRIYRAIRLMSYRPEYLKECPFVQPAINTDFEKSLFVPCGSCKFCLIRRTAHWAVRCMHEASLHETNCFLTLTYGDGYLPKDGLLVKEHLTKFIKSLREYLRVKGIFIRYFACGEYGDLNQRPHYHLLIFGYDFPDKKPFTRRKNNVIYLSPLLQKLWPYGISSVGNVSFQSARYVAAYIHKKRRDLGKGCLQSVEPYIASSLKPGLGHDWLLKYRSDVYSKDKVVYYVNDKPRFLPPPRYYDKLMAKYYPEEWKLIVERRLKRFGNVEELSFDYSDFKKCEARDQTLSQLLKLYSRPGY